MDTTLADQDLLVDVFDKKITGFFIKDNNQTTQPRTSWAFWLLRFSYSMSSFSIIKSALPTSVYYKLCTFRLFFYSKDINQTLNQNFKLKPARRVEKKIRARTHQNSRFNSLTICWKTKKPMRPSHGIQIIIGLDLKLGFSTDTNHLADCVVFDFQFLKKKNSLAKTRTQL